MPRKIVINSDIRRTLLIFVMIYFSNVTLLFGTNSNGRLITLSRYGCLVLTVCLAVRVIVKKIKINRVGIPFLIFLLVQVINVFLGKSTYQIMFVQMTYILCAFLLCLLYDIHELKKSFCQVIYFFAFCSIVVSLIGMLLPFISESMPLITNVSGTKYHFFLLAGRYADAGLVQRNLGIFWEAGTFCIFLNVAIFILLFENAAKVQLKKITVLSLAEIMTLSTGGIACLLLIIAYYAVSENGNRGTKQKTLILIIVLGFLVLLFFEDVIVEQIFVRNLAKGVTTSGSSIARYVSVVGNIRIAQEHPILGCGYSNIRNLFIQESIDLFSYEMRTDANTNTILYNFAVNGFVYGTVLCVGLLRAFLNMIKENPTTKTVIFTLIFIFVLFMNENLQNSSFVYVISFIGYRYNWREKYACQRLGYAGNNM